MGQRFLGAMPCVAIVLTTYSLGVGPSWAAMGSQIIPMIDTTWAAVNLLLVCFQSLPLDCSPHISPILEDSWGILNIGHAACCPISTFFRGGNKVAACSWKSFILDIILRMCLSALPSSSGLSLMGAFYAVEYCLSSSSDVSRVSYLSGSLCLHLRSLAALNHCGVG